MYVLVTVSIELNKNACDSLFARDMSIHSSFDRFKIHAIKF